MTATNIEWTDVEVAARQLAGNWRRFDSFAWHRSHGLEDADRWCIWYTSNRDAGLLEQSNETVFNKRLAPFAEGDNPDVVFEEHAHWVCGFVRGFSVRTIHPDGTPTEAFREFCQIKERLEDYPVLNESHYSDLEYAATLENYASEMGRLTDGLPAGWESEVFSWFSDNGHDRYTANLDDRGGWAPREAIVTALQDLGLLPTAVVEN